MRKLVFAFIVVADYDPRHSHDAAAEGAAPEPTAQVTVWEARFEIFIEHKRAVVGAPTSFVTHVTDLQTREARREGRVAFLWRHGDIPPIERVEQEPKRPGIYIPEITLPKAGEWAFRLRIDDREIELPKIVVYASRDEARRAAVPDAPEGVSFLKEQQWKLRTKIEVVAARRLVERLRLPGVISARPGSRANVLPPLSGRVLAVGARPFPSLGEKVEAGQVLALLQPPVSDLAAKLIEAEANVVRTKLALDQADLSHARVEKLAAGGARTARELEESDFARRAARGAHEASVVLRTAYQKAGLSLEHGGVPVFELRSPIAGRVIHIGAAVGEQVPDDRAVFIVLSSDHVLVEARIAEADVPRVGASREAVYETSDAKGRFTPLGKLAYLGPEVDAATRSVPLVYEAANPDGRLRIGMALSVYVETNRADEAIAVPDGAVVEEDGRPVAFVQLTGETFEKRDLKLGLRDSGFVQILDGLRPGERVVTQGAYAVRLASVSTSLPAHGHSH